MQPIPRGGPLPINQALNRSRSKLGLDLTAWMATRVMSGRDFASLETGAGARAANSSVDDLSECTWLYRPKRERAAIADRHHKLWMQPIQEESR